MGESKDRYDIVDAAINEVGRIDEVSYGELNNITFDLIDLITEEIDINSFREKVCNKIAEFLEPYKIQEEVSQNIHNIVYNES